MKPKRQGGTGSWFSNLRGNGVLLVYPRRRRFMPDSTPTAEEDRRRSPRVSLVVPMVVVWTRKDGLRLRERAETKDISVHGALLQVATPLGISTEVELSRPGTTSRFWTRVVRIDNRGPQGVTWIGIELSDPADAFCLLPPGSL